MCLSFSTCHKMIVDQQSRDLALKAKQESDARLEARVNAAVKAHGLDDDDLSELRSGGCFSGLAACLPFGSRRPRAQRVAGEETGVQLQRGQSSTWTRASSASAANRYRRQTSCSTRRSLSKPTSNR